MAILHTKYSLNDTVYFMKNNQVVKDKVIGISVTSFINRNEVQIVSPHYNLKVNNASTYAEPLLYPSKEDLLKSL